MLRLIFRRRIIRTNTSMCRCTGAWQEGRRHLEFKFYCVSSRLPAAKLWSNYNYPSLPWVVHLQCLEKKVPCYRCACYRNSATNVQVTSSCWIQWTRHSDIYRRVTFLHVSWPDYSLLRYHLTKLRQVHFWQKKRDTPVEWTCYRRLATTFVYEEFRKCASAASFRWLTCTLLVYFKMWQVSCMAVIIRSDSCRSIVLPSNCIYS